jgi:hypothetical protein
MRRAAEGDRVADVQGIDKADGTMGDQAGVEVADARDLLHCGAGGLGTQGVQPPWVQPPFQRRQGYRPQTLRASRLDARHRCDALELVGRGEGRHPCAVHLECFAEELREVAADLPRHGSGPPGGDDRPGGRLVR